MLNINSIKMYIKWKKVFVKILPIKDHFMRQKKFKTLSKLFQSLYVHFDKIKNLLSYFITRLRDYFIIKWVIHVLKKIII